MAHGDVPPEHDLRHLRVLASTGEPWNEGPWRWYAEQVGGGRCPVINISAAGSVGRIALAVAHSGEQITPPVLDRRLHPRSTTLAAYSRGTCSSFARGIII